MSVALTLLDTFLTDLTKAVHNLPSDAITAVLSNTNIDVTTGHASSGITEIANGNGYSTGGVTITSPAITVPTAGTVMFDCDDFEWTSSGSGMAAFQYGYLVLNSKIMAKWDHGSSLTVPAGAKYHVNVDTNGVFRATRTP